MQAFRLARDQGSDYYMATALLEAVMIASSELRRGSTGGGTGCAISLPSAQAAVAAFAQAEPAFKRCKRLLPQEWTACLRDTLPAARGVWEESQAHLQLIRAQQQLASGSSQGRAAHAHTRELLGRAVAASHAVAQATEHSTAPWDNSRNSLALRCDGCGQTSVGLQRCGRCKRTRHCSRACQLAHWPQHRADCRPA
ncbi:hypothetical protein ABPG75_012824 [Micractinium tetrahymenae]